jgi:hypothetical protein
MMPSTAVPHAKAVHVSLLHIHKLMVWFKGTRPQLHHASETASLPHCLKTSHVEPNWPKDFMWSAEKRLEGHNGYNHCCCCCTCRCLLCPTSPAPLQHLPHCVHVKRRSPMRALKDSRPGSDAAAAGVAAADVSLSEA